MKIKCYFGEPREKIIYSFIRHSLDLLHNRHLKFFNNLICLYAQVQILGYRQNSIKKLINNDYKDTSNY